jgi:hypothetical protein
MLWLRVGNLSVNDRSVSCAVGRTWLQIRYSNARSNDVSYCRWVAVPSSADAY